MKVLPPGWALSTIGDVADYIQRGRGPTYVALSSLPVINQKCIRWHGIDAAHIKFVDEKTREQWGLARFLRPGDVLWNSTGTGTLGRAALFDGLPGFEEVVVDSHVTVVRVTASEPKYVHYWIRSPTIQGRLERMQAGSTNQVELPRAEVVATELPLAPISEQRRIVAKLDTIFDQTRAAKARLDRLPALFEKLKRSILAAAFRGDLTKDWRAANPEVESAVVLLDAIRDERRQRWEYGIRAKGKDPSKAKFSEPAPSKVESLPELPEKWVWTTVDAVCTDVVDCPHSTPVWTESKTGFRCVRTTEFAPGALDVQSARFVREETYKARTARLAPRVGDVLYSREGGILGIACAVPVGDPVCLGQRMMLMRLSSLLPSAWLTFWLNGPFVGEVVRSLVVGTASPHLNVGDVVRFPVPLPPIGETQRVLELVEAAFARIDSDTASRLRARVSRLEQASLAKAFSGDLVQQDPTDEPATVLLNRIRAARAAEPALPARGRGKRAAERATPGNTSFTNYSSPATSHNDDSLDLVVGLFQIDRRLTMSAIAEATGLDTSAVKKVLKTLVEGGQVRVNGRAHAATYVWSP